MQLKARLLINFTLLKHLMEVSPLFFIANLINTILEVLGGLFQMVFYQKMLDLIVYSHISLEQTIIYFIIFYFVNIVLFVVNYLITTYFNEKEKIKINLYYKQMIYTETIQNELACYNNSTYMNRLHNAIYHDGSYLYSFAFRLFSLVNAILSLCGVAYVFFQLHPAFVIGAVLIAIKNVIISQKKNQILYSKHEANLILERAKTYVDNIFYLKNYVRELRLYSIGKYFRKKFIHLNELFWNKNKKYCYRIYRFETLNALVDNMVYVINIIMLVLLMNKNEITVGEFSLVLSRFTSLAIYIENILMFLAAIENDTKYTKEILSVINEKKHEFPKFTNDYKKEDGIYFEDVFFAYNEGPYVIRNINLAVPFRKKIAIVGENGSGKSTFIKLLMGLYHPVSGKINYIYQNEKGYVKKLFSTMFQDFQIYALSVAENIMPTYDADKRDDVMNVIKFCELEGRIELLKHGIETQMTKEFDDEGVYFSGGEQQKVALARAYASERPILILDEPSSKLDPLAERKIIEKVNDMTEHKTVILVTHNLLHAQSADLVYFFEEGQVIESGTPEELINLKGKYYNMLNLQIKQLAREKYE